MLRAPHHPLDPHALKAVRMDMLAKFANVAHAERDSGLQRAGERRIIGPAGVLSDKKAGSVSSW